MPESLKGWHFSILKKLSKCFWSSFCGVFSKLMSDRIFESKQVDLLVLERFSLNLHPSPPPISITRWMGTWQRFQAGQHTQQIVNNIGFMKYVTKMLLTICYWIRKMLQLLQKIRNDVRLFLPYVKLHGFILTKECQHFWRFAGDLDVLDTSSSVFTARSQLTLNGVPQVRWGWPSCCHREPEGWSYHVTCDWMWMFQ